MSAQHTTSYHASVSEARNIVKLLKSMNPNLRISAIRNVKHINGSFYAAIHQNVMVPFAGLRPIGTTDQTALISDIISGMQILLPNVNLFHFDAQLLSAQREPDLSRFLHLLSNVTSALSSAKHKPSPVDRVRRCSLGKRSVLYSPRTRAHKFPAAKKSCPTGAGRVDGQAPCSSNVFARKATEALRRQQRKMQNSIAEKALQLHFEADRFERDTRQVEVQTLRQRQTVEQRLQTRLERHAERRAIHMERMAKEERMRLMVSRQIKTRDVEAQEMKLAVEKVRKERREASWQAARELRERLNVETAEFVECLNDQHEKHRGHVKRLQNDVVDAENRRMRARTALQDAVNRIESLH